MNAFQPERILIHGKHHCIIAANLVPTFRDVLAHSRVLVVDDEMATVRFLTRLLNNSGADVSSTTDARLVPELVASHDPDLIILDLHMPHMDGFEVMEKLGPLRSPLRYLPVLVLTGDTASAVKQRALRVGARDFLSKPFDTVEALLRIRNLLTTRHFYVALEREQQRLEESVRERTRELADAHLEIVGRLARAAEYRDDNTGEHTRRVGRLSGELARMLGYDADAVEMIERAAALHDVGKVGVPDAILLKPGPLTPAEIEIMRTHAVVGAKILSNSRAPLLRMAEAIALTHHERWDGTGYPAGLREEHIPFVGRIVALADAFDAMTHSRPYQSAVPVGLSVEMLTGLRGRSYDPAVVDAFTDLHRQGRLTPHSSTPPTSAA
jgi:putative two-component system response regulator